MINSESGSSMAPHVGPTGSQKPPILFQFPRNRVGIGFPAFAFSSRKLPKAAMPFMERPPTNEHAILPEDDCGHNADFGGVHDLKNVADESQQTQAKVKCVNNGRVDLPLGSWRVFAKAVEGGVEFQPFEGGGTVLARAGICYRLKLAFQKSLERKVLIQFRPVETEGRDLNVLKLRFGAFCQARTR